MENASKALIIAGAILLSVLIVSLGIMVYNNAKNTVGSANLSKQEMETFNSQWQAYEGSKKTASEVKTMVQAIIASNAAENTAGTNRFITVSPKSAGAKTTRSTTLPTGITVPSATDCPNSSTYTIVCGYKDGMVCDIAWKAN